jgi:hypothetical protein
MVQSQPGQVDRKTLSRKPLHKKGLVEWLKVQALSSSPSTAKKKKNTHTHTHTHTHTMRRWEPQISNCLFKDRVLGVFMDKET